jgi:hypothetical protein
MALGSIMGTIVHKRLPEAPILPGNAQPAETGVT